jgi:hypothetical protein
MQVIFIEEGFSTNTIKSYLTAVTALLNHVSSTGEHEGDRAAARLLEGIYRSKHAIIRHDFFLGV